MNYRYNFRDLFSLSSNIDYFDGLLHGFRTAEIPDGPRTFQFILDKELRISLRDKPRFNLMLGYDAQTHSIEFAYPWIRPVYARLTFGRSGFQFSFNKNYLRFSNIVGEGWEVNHVFRSLLMVSLISSGMYLVHGAAIKLGEDGILMPSFANTGKTTTSWTLCKQGAKYLTDELAVLDSYGNCLSLPCSSLVTPSLAKILGLNLTRHQKISMRMGMVKSRLFSVRFVAGGLRLYPEEFFEVCDSVKITKLTFIQNGVDDFRKLTLDEGVARLMAIRSLELGWDSNPYVIAESFFNPNFNLETFRRTERTFVASFLGRMEDIELVSSSNGSHYKALEHRPETGAMPILREPSA